jgi:hypothetical protein
MTKTKTDEMNADLSKVNGKRKIFSEKLVDLKKTCEKLCVTSSAQGLPKIFQYENTYARSFWLLVFLAFSFATFWLFVRGILDYLEYDVVSKIRVHNEASLEYPIMTFCGSFPFPANKSQEVFSDFEQQPLHKAIETFLNDSIEAISDKKYLNRSFTYLDYLNFGMQKAFYMSEKSKRELGYDLKEILQFCQFNGALCGISDFAWFFSYQHGNCFQFKPKLGEVKRKLSGSMYGFTLAFKNIRNFNKFSINHGIKVFIHNSSYVSSSAQQTLVETGKTTNIELKKSFTYRQPSPYSRCEELIDSKSDLDELKGQYRQSDCVGLCLQRNFIQACHCFHIFFAELSNASAHPCYENKETLCVSNLISSSLSKLTEKCFSQCPLECDFVQYELRSSSFTYPTRENFNFIQNDLLSNEDENSTWEEYINSHLTLNIFFPSQEYTEIRETPKMLVLDLISNLGGVLGIFLGFSIFTMIEIVEVFIQIVVILIRR